MQSILSHQLKRLHMIRTSYLQNHSLIVVWNM